ncbi:MAG: hypothetical protein ACP5QU_01100 [Anaerolineae bacterium]
MNTRRHPLFFLVLLITALGCMVFTPPSSSQEETPFPAPATLPASETETPFAICTPPLCTLDETYHCPGTCPGGCGTTCATTTPDPALLPLTKIEGAGIWLMKQDELNIVSFDPAGKRSAYAFQRTPLLLANFILSHGGGAFLLRDPGDGTLKIVQVYPRQREVGTLDAGRNLEGSALWEHPPIFSADGQMLIWSRPAEGGKQVLFATSLESGESRALGHLTLPPEASGHTLLPLYYDDSRHLLVYALHAFYSGMSIRQVASLYLAQIDTNQVTPLVGLNPIGIYAGYSAAVSGDGTLLAYLTYSGEPDQDYNLKWIVHIHPLSGKQEHKIPIPTPLSNAEVLTFSPDGKALLLRTDQYLNTNAGVDSIHRLTRIEIESKNLQDIYSVHDLQTPMSVQFEPLAWLTSDWLILKSSEDASTWVMRADGSSLVQVTLLEWLGLLEEPMQ